jgi:hypothetical protein
LLGSTYVVIATDRSDAQTEIKPTGESCDFATSKKLKDVKICYFGSTAEVAFPTSNMLKCYITLTVSRYFRSVPQILKQTIVISSQKKKSKRLLLICTTDLL